MLFHMKMKTLQKFILLSLCLLCWHCSCDSKLIDEISTKKPSNNEVPVFHSIVNTPLNQDHNVHIQNMESKKSDQITVAKEIKVPNKKQMLRHIDVRIAKYKEQLRKMRRRHITSSLVDKKKQKSTISNTVNIIEVSLHKSDSENVETIVQKAPIDSKHVEIELSKIEKISEGSLAPEKTVESQGTSQENVLIDIEVQKPNFPESKDSLETAELKDSLETAETSHHPHSDTMPSFDEWKKMMLAEQEKDGHKIPSVSPPGKKISSQKRHRNYASYECGAKVVASNSDAEGTTRILNERLDEYMLNPCKAKAWFVIELCETVQVSTIELANFELFSSCPKDFTVAFSDNFPTRDWVPAGSFTAAEQRILQSFQAKSEGFIKFIKVDLLSHYGKEHYCPLNVVRVFGTSMVDEYEEMEKMSDHRTSSDDDLDRLDIPVEDKSSLNLFGSATNVVYNMVKGIGQALVRNVPANESPDTTIDHNISSESKQCRLVDDSCVVEDNKTTSELNTSDSQDLPSAIQNSLYNHLQHCDQCLSFSNSLHYSNAPLPQCRFFQAALGPVNFKSICDWLKAHYVLPFEESAPVNISQNYTKEEDKKQSPPPTIISVIIDSKSRKQTMPSYSDMTPPMSREDMSPQKTSQLPLSYRTDKDKSKLTEKILKPDIQPTKTLPVTKDDAYSDSPDTSKVKLSTDKDHTLEINTVVEKEEKVAPSIQVPPVKIDDSQQPTTAVPLQTEVLGQNLTKKSESDEKVRKSEEKNEFNDEEQLSIDLENTGVDIVTTEASVKDFAVDTNMKIDPVIVGGGTFSASQKESVFVRMNNRIKALELNMSLSSQYLQELSQRYRRQMEEMQRAFNRTIGTLNDTAKKAAERDLKQQEIIGNLQSQLSNLTTTVNEIMNKHILLMVAEIIIMVTIMSLCVRRISSVSRSSLSQAVTVPENITRPSRSDMKRRNSSGSCSPPSLKRIKKRSSSDEALHTDELLIVEPSAPIIIEPPPKIKRRKKKKQMKRSASNPVTSPRKCSSASLKKLLKSDKTCTAGLLFTHMNFEKDSMQHNCENYYNDKLKNCDFALQNPTAEKRLHSVPLKNLTNGDLTQHNLKTLASKQDKFSIRKFLRLQKRESI